MKREFCALYCFLLGILEFLPIHGFLSAFQNGICAYEESCSYFWLAVNSENCFIDNWLCFIHLLTTSKWTI